MDKVHSRALEALQPFIHLATSSSSPTPRFVVELITNATSSPSTFVFAELLETRAVQALRSPETPEEYRPYLTLLEIFAWGTWEEYHSTPNMPTLNEKQSEKLRLLSLLTLATTHVPLTYSIVMKSLSLPDTAALESLVTKAIYSSLITARLSPATTPATVHVTSTAPLRDVRPQTVSSMISVLSEWQGRCGDVIGGIEAEIAKTRSDAEKRRAEEKSRAALVERTMKGRNGDKDDPSSGAGGPGPGAGTGSGSGSKHTHGFSRETRSGLRQHFAGMYGGGGSNKREFSDTNDSSMSDHGRDEGFGGSETAIDSGKGLSGEAMRQAKRILAVGARS